MELWQTFIERENLTMSTESNFTPNYDITISKDHYPLHYTVWCSRPSVVVKIKWNDNSNSYHNIQDFVAINDKFLIADRNLYNAFVTKSVALLQEEMMKSTGGDMQKLLNIITGNFPKSLPANDSEELY